MPSSHENVVQSVAGVDSRRVELELQWHVDVRVDINEAYYYNLLLSQQLLPAIHQMSGKFTFQQDIAPVYRTH